MPSDQSFDWWTWLTVAFVPFGVWLFVLDRRRESEVVGDWAAQNHVTLVRRLATWYRISPFVLSILLSSNQKIEYWIVRDSVGLEHRVWFKIGNFFRGATREIEAEWE